jgi:glutamate synthase (NADPH/NADH) large chain
MANTGAEPIGSMGTDTPIAALSAKPRLLFDYFSQLFAQVTNPPLDAIREELVTSLSGTIGPEANLLEPTRRRAARWCCRPGLLQRRPGQDPAHQPRRRHARLHHPRLRGLYAVEGGGAAMAERIDEICARCPRRSPGEPGSSCSPTGTRPPSSRRSRRCC